MCNAKSLALYKGKCAIVREAGEKITIKLQNGGEVKVREKDIILLHPGPLESFDQLPGPPPAADAALYWELFLEEQEAAITAGKPGAVTLRELATLAFSEWTPQSAWAAWLLLEDGLYFTGTPQALCAQSRDLVEAAQRARTAKETECRERGAFLARLKERKLVLPADAAFLQDVEALALGHTEKSRTLRDIGVSETPEDAHKILLLCGVWDYFVNPYPAREGLTLKPAKAQTEPPPADEARAQFIDAAHTAYAIDNEDSNDPDDALAAQEQDDGRVILFVHVADPAAGVLPGCEADVEARKRGATVYLPEQVCRMFHDQALAQYALGVGETSPALTFKITLNKAGCIEATEILPTTVAVRRLTYRQADTILTMIDNSDLDSGANAEDTLDVAACKKTLALLNLITRRNIERRLAAGASIIDFPETHIEVNGREIVIDEPVSYESAVIVRECMLLAGEAAAQWALARRLPFPFVSQEHGDAPKEYSGGLAGAYQLRRCMRPRVLSAKPGLHWGLGLDVYTQVTSPLRRYTDLLCHQQIRAVLAGRTSLDEDEILCRLAVSERGAIAATRAGKASVAHWIRVYLADKINSVWEAIILDRKGPNVAVVFIPRLALETQCTLHGEALKLKPNDTLNVTVSSIKIAEGVVNVSI